MEKIFITWKSFERSQSFSGTLIGYISESGIIGSFSEDLLHKYQEILEIIDEYNMKNTKTALTELIEKWESEMGSYIPNAPIYKAFIEEAKTFLEKEKQQISNAYENGAFDFQGTNKEVTNGDGLDYFEKTYPKHAVQPKLKMMD